MFRPVFPVSSPRSQYFVLPPNQMNFIITVISKTYLIFFLIVLPKEKSLTNISWIKDCSTLDKDTCKVSHLGQWWCRNRTPRCFLRHRRTRRRQRSFPQGRSFLEWQDCSEAEPLHQSCRPQRARPRWWCHRWCHPGQCEGCCQGNQWWQDRPRQL